MPESLGAALRPGMGQLGAALEWLPIAGAEGDFHRVQKSRDGYLLLTPNEGFFPRLGLLAGGNGVAPDQENLNGGKSFDHVTEWDRGDVVEWAVWLDRPGEVALRVWMSASAGSGAFEVSLGAARSAFNVESIGDEVPVRVHEWVTTVTGPGRHLVSVVCTGEVSRETRLHWVELAGPAVTNGGVLRKRWRPAAAHTAFYSTAASDGVRMWVMEMDAVPGELGFYAPITTPFGYYGPTWLADGRVNTGMNFSLWSYGRNEKEPPINELSHLLAIGNPEAKFGGFGHEGTGVKIRDWEPLAGRQGQAQAFALRVEPGRDFNTYFSYFYAADEKRWRLFGVGRQKSKRRPVTHLGVGSFVEVPGPPPRQRTGSTIRRMRYRGWVSRDGAEWHPLDRMKAGDIDRETGLTYTDRGLDGDGWFFLQTGGWVFRRADGQDVVGVGSIERPEYLAPDRVASLLELPSEIEMMKASHDSGQIRLTYRLRGLGGKAEAFAYHGTSEGLTFADRWSRRTALPEPHEGENQATIRVGKEGATRVRLFLRNGHGQFWSSQTTLVQ